MWQKLKGRREGQACAYLQSAFATKYFIQVGELPDFPCDVDKQWQILIYWMTFVLSFHIFCTNKWKMHEEYNLVSE